MNKYLMSIGYPMGMLEEEEGLIGMVDLNNSTVLLSFLEYSIWKVIFKSSKESELIEQCKLISKDVDVNSILKKLKEKGLVIEIIGEDKFENSYEKIKDYKLFRQGTGIGFDPEKENTYKVAIQKDEVSLDILEYTVWLYSNNNTKIEDMYKAISERGIESLSIFMIVILNLYQKNLIYIMKRE